MDNQQNAKTIADRRKSTRIQTENDVGYILFDANREVADQGRAKALDLSQNGHTFGNRKTIEWLLHYADHP